MSQVSCSRRRRHNPGMALQQDFQVADDRTLTTPASPCASSRSSISFSSDSLALNNTILIDHLSDEPSSPLSTHRPFVQPQRSDATTQPACRLMPQFQSSPSASCPPRACKLRAAAPPVTPSSGRRLRKSRRRVLCDRGMEQLLQGMSLETDDVPAEPELLGGSSGRPLEPSESLLQSSHVCKLRFMLPRQVKNPAPYLCSLECR